MHGLLDASDPMRSPTLPDGLVETLASRLEEAVLVVGADHRVALANPAAGSLLGIAPGAVGSRLEDAIADYRLCVMVGTCLASGEEIERNLDDPGEGRHVAARATAVRDPAGRVAGVVVVLRDDSQLRRLERVRRDFVANVSHELRTPIAAISLLVETLQSGALVDVEVASEFVNKIGLEVAHMAQMVSELLELSTMEAGLGGRQPRRVEIAALLAAADRLQPLADERGLRMVHDVAPDAPPALGDEQALGQVVRNLVHNAIKFTQPGGWIALTARGLDGGRVELRVADSGCGIPASELPRVFERFYKADKSRRRDGEGTGLGLAIARHTVEASGGTIRVESEVGVGSTFIVVLPAG